MDAIIEREIKHAIGTMTAPAMASHVSDLAYIHTCISTAYDLLSGEAYKRIGDSIIAASVRDGRPKIDQEKDAREAVRDLVRK
jgi:hypothetical protein